MTGLHESTLALSVYNAVARLGTLNGAQLLEVLRRNWDNRVEPDEIQQGVSYLLKRKMVTIADGVVAPAKLEGGAARTILRNPIRQTELIWGAGAQQVRGGNGLGVLG
jgi:hypothetical protein